jgi:hypothetical protein
MLRRAVPCRPSTQSQHRYGARALEAGSARRTLHSALGSASGRLDGLPQASPQRSQASLCESPRGALAAAWGVAGPLGVSRLYKVSGQGRPLGLSKVGPQRQPARTGRFRLYKVRGQAATCCGDCRAICSGVGSFRRLFLYKVRCKDRGSQLTHSQHDTKRLFRMSGQSLAADTTFRLGEAPRNWT